MYYVAQQTTKWVNGQPAPIPKIISDPIPDLDAAKAEAARKNEAEGRAYDGSSVPLHFFVIEGRSA
jgi:hypothetical protein